MYILQAFAGLLHVQLLQCLLFIILRKEIMSGVLSATPAF